MRQDTFVEQVRDALSRLHERAYLETHFLARLLPAGPSTGREGERLRRLLLDAVEELRPPGDARPDVPEWRRYRYLHLRYLQGLTHDGAVEELGISRRQGHRDHHEAVEALSSLLWSRFQKRQPQQSPPGGGQSEADGSGSGQTPENLLEAELLKLGQVADRASTDLPTVLDAVLRTVANLAASRQVRIPVAREPDLPLAAMHRAALRQVLLGVLSYLLDNCSGGEVEVRAAADGTSIQLTLTSPAVDRGRPAQGRNTGLATEDSRVRVSQRLLEMQGGSVDLATSRPDQGLVLTFRLRIPAVRPVVVLVVDDDPDFGQLVRRYLHGHPYRVLLANTAEQALQLADEAAPQMVLLDVLMPSQDGWEILQELRQRDRTKEVPTIICSVLIDHTLARSLGVTHFLAKPVTQRDLLAVLEECQALGSASPGLPASTEKARSP